MTLFPKKITKMHGADLTVCSCGLSRSVAGGRGGTHLEAESGSSQVDQVERNVLHPKGG